mmetsp:Transcript_20750/g.49044  ORF Transcript_20750/g.49044 Transcript_20750/m.49044 type:complete len:233 (+) Transcript_20750:837-1535(+)
MDTVELTQEIGKASSGSNCKGKIGPRCNLLLASLGRQDGILSHIRPLLVHLLPRCGLDKPFGSLFRDILLALLDVSSRGRLNTIGMLLQLVLDDKLLNLTQKLDVGTYDEIGHGKAGRRAEGLLVIVQGSGDPNLDGVQLIGMPVACDCGREHDAVGNGTRISTLQGLAGHSAVPTCPLRSLVHAGALERLGTHNTELSFELGPTRRTMARGQWRLARLAAAHVVTQSLMVS